MKSNHNTLFKISKYILVISLIVVVIGYFNKDNFVELSVNEKNLLLNEPLQDDKYLDNISTQIKDKTFNVYPIASYELTGLIVSYKNHTSTARFSIHSMTQDHINISDICVVWGKNATDLDLNQFDFYNGDFTCNVRTASRAIWNRFDMTKLSNNHLLTDVQRVASNIRSVSIGDIIKIKGHLSAYKHAGFERGTSLVRTDTGNGACETIWVEDFEIIESTFSLWRVFYYFAWFSLTLSLCSLIFGIGFGYF